MSPPVATVANVVDKALETKLDTWLDVIPTAFATSAICLAPAAIDATSVPPPTIAFITSGVAAPTPPPIAPVSAALAISPPPMAAYNAEVPDPKIADPNVAAPTAPSPKIALPMAKDAPAVKGAIAIVIIAGAMVSIPCKVAP